MKPLVPKPSFSLRGCAILMLALSLTAGCTAPTVRSQSPDLEELQGASGLKALRVGINLNLTDPTEEETSTAKDDIEKIIEEIEVEM